MEFAAPVNADRTLAAMLAEAGALERSGDWHAADEEYSRIFARAVAGRQPKAMADALRRQAEMRSLGGAGEEGEELAWLSLEIAERNGLAAEAARALNVLACVLYGRGDYEAARALYEAALSRARVVRDGHLVGLACQNLGVLANIRGDLTEARSLYLESIASSVRSGDRATAMTVYHNLGMVCGDMGDWLEAELYFDRGIDLADRAGSLPLFARLYVSRVEPLIHLSEFVRARKSLERARALAEQVSDAVARAAVERFEGILARLEGNLPAAERHLERALEIAEAAGAELERAEATGGLATVRGLQGRHEEERALLEGALTAFQRLGASREAARIDARLRELEAGAPS
jgi:tetratricopeptide (TPR) repeat protein